MTSMQQIQELRERGWFVKVSHRRPVVDDTHVPGLIYGPLAKHELMSTERHTQTGGQTWVVLRHPESGVYTGIAWCSPRDQFNKAIGLSIALGRAMKKAGLS